MKKFVSFVVCTLFCAVCFTLTSCGGGGGSKGYSKEYIEKSGWSTDRYVDEMYVLNQDMTLGRNGLCVKDMRYCNTNEKPAPGDPLVMVEGNGRFFIFKGEEGARPIHNIVLARDWVKDNVK